jgi:hypothetical protein
LVLALVKGLGWVLTDLDTFAAEWEWSPVEGWVVLVVCLIRPWQDLLLLMIIL